MATTELQELGEDTSDLADGFSKYRDEIKSLTGFDIEKSNGEYKDMYEIFTGLAGVWEKMASGKAQQRVAEILGGTRNMSGIMSTIKNIKDAEGAYTNAMNAQNVAMKANDKHMDTTEAKIGKLKASFQEFSTDAISTDFMKGAIGGINGLVSALDSLVQKFGLLGSVAMLGGAGFALAKLPSIIFSIQAALIGSGTVLTNLSSMISPVGVAILGVTAAVAALAAAFTVFDHFNVTFDEAKDAASEAQQEYEDAKSKVEDYNNKIEETGAKIDALQGKHLNAVEEVQLSNLQQYNDALQAQVGIWKDIEKAKQQNSAKKAKEAIDTKQSYDSGILVDEYEQGIATGKKTSLGGYGTVTQAIFDQNKSIAVRTKALNEQASELAGLRDARDKAKEAYDSGTGSKKDYKSANKAYEDAEKAYNTESDNIEALKQDRSTLIESAGELLSQLVDSEGAVLPGYEDTYNSLQSAIQQASVEDQTTNADLYAYMRRHVTEMDDLRKLAEDNKNNGGITKADIIKEGLGDGLAWSNISASDLVKQINGEVGVSEIQNAEKEAEDQMKAIGDVFTDHKEAYDKLSEKAKDKRTKGGITAKDINGLGKDFLDDMKKSGYTATDFAEYINSEQDVLNMNTVASILKKKFEKSIEDGTDLDKNSPGYQDAIGNLTDWYDSLSADNKAALYDAIQEGELDVSDLPTNNAEAVLDAWKDYLDKHVSDVSADYDKAKAAYDDYKNALDATPNTQNLEGAAKAAQEINDTLSNQKSSNYGQTNKESYKSALDYIIPEEFQNVQLNTVAASIKNGGKKVSYALTKESSNVNSKLSEARDNLNAELEEAKKLNVDFNKTKFGNIDTNNRAILSWDDNTLESYKNVLESWEELRPENDRKSWEEIKKDLKGKYSTVLGSYFNKGDIEGLNYDLAYSPLLQTDNGAKYLDAQTVTDYIWEIVNNSKVQKAKNADEAKKAILELDKVGVQWDDSTYIKGLIADVGDTAAVTDQQMHFVGKDGSIANLKKEVEKYSYTHTVDAIGDIVKNVSENPPDTNNVNNRIKQYMDSIEDVVYKDASGEITGFDYAGIAQRLIKSGDAVFDKTKNAYVINAKKSIGELSKDTNLSEAVIKSFQDALITYSGNESQFDMTTLLGLNESQVKVTLSDASNAFKVIGDTLNNAKSEIFGQKGGTDYQNALSFIPSDVDTTDENAVKSYMNKIKGLFNYDSNGNIAGVNIGEVLRQGINKGLLKISDDGTITGLGSLLKEDFMEAFDVSGSMADALMEGISSYGDNVNYADILKNQADAMQSQVQGYVSSLTSLQSVLTSQGTGQSLSLDTYNSEELQAYTSALEYNNGVLQYNVDEVNALAQAQAEVQKNDIAQEKSMVEDQYLANAQAIEEYRSQLIGANDEEAAAISANISSLSATNDALYATINQYDLMAASIDEATSAYQNWINAQKATESGDMYDSATTAFNKIEDTLNNQKSDNFGKVGRKDYQAAIDFVIPDTIDKNNQEAVDNYLDSVSRYVNTEEQKDGTRKFTGLNLDNFLNDSVEKGLMTKTENDDGTESFEIKGKQTMQAFADGMNMSLPLVQAIFGELEEYGAHFNWEDGNQSLQDLAVNANEAADSLKGIDKYKDLKLVLNVDNFEDKQKAVDTLDDTINEIKNSGALSAGVDTSEYQDAVSILEYCVAEKQKLTEPAIMSVDTSQVSGEIGNAIALLQQYQTAKNQLESAQVTFGVDSTQASTAQAQVDTAVQNIQNSNHQVMIQLGVDTANEATIAQSIQNISADNLIKLGVDSSAIDSYKPADKDMTVKANVDHSAVDSYSPPEKTMIIRQQIVKSESSSGTHDVNGTANVTGTAHARGNWGASGGKALVGELGQEIMVDPHNGTWKTVGNNGAEFVNVPQNAIIFNHRQTAGLLKNGSITGRGKAFAHGTAHAGTDRVSGGLTLPKIIIYNNGGRGAGSGSGSGSGSNRRYNRSSRRGSNGSNKKDSALEKFKKWLSEIFDWVEVKLSRQSDRIDATIDRAERAAKAGNYSRAKVNYQTAIQEQQTQIANEQGAVDKYSSFADSILSKAVKQKLISNKQANEIQSRMVDGTLDISEYGERMQEVLKDYQTWYEKSRNAAQEIEKLSQSITDNINSIHQSYRDNSEKQVDLLTKMAQNATSVADKNKILDQIANIYPKITKDTKQAADEYARMIADNQRAIAGNDVKRQEVVTITSGSQAIKQAKSSGKKLSKKKGTTPALKKKNKKTRNKVNSLVNKIKGNAKKGKVISASDMKKLLAYKNEGLVSDSFYNDCVSYNEQAGMSSAAKKVDKLGNTLSKTSYKGSKYNKANKKTRNSVDKTVKAIKKEAKSNKSLSSAQLSTLKSYKDKGYISKNFYQKAVNYNKQVEKANAKLTKSETKVTKTTATTKKFKKAKKKTKNAVNSVVNRAKAAAKSGKAISSSDLNKLQTYVNQGLVASAFYSQCVAYNNNLDARDAAAQQLQVDEQDQIAQRVAAGQEKLENIQNEYDIQTDKIQKQQGVLEAKQKTKQTRGHRMKVGDYRALSSYQEQLKQTYIAEANALRATIQDNLNKGLWTTGTEEYRKAMNDLIDYKSKIEECTNAQEEYNNAVAQLPFDILGDALDLLQSIADYNNSVIDYRNSRGIKTTKRDYRTQMSDNNHQIVNYMSQRNKAYQNYIRALDNADGVYGGKRADEWKKMYTDLDTDIMNLRKDNEELNNSIYNIPLDRIQEALDMISAMEDYFDSIVTLQKTKGIIPEASAYQSSLDQMMQEMNKYSKQANVYSKYYWNAMRDPDKVFAGKTADEWNQLMVEAQTNINKTKNSIEDIKNTIAQIPYEKIERYLDLLDATASANTERVNAKSAKGIDLSEQDYLTQIDDNNKKYNELLNKRSQLYSDYVKALNNPEGVYGGKSSQEWLAEYYNTDADISKIIEDNEKLKDSLRDDVYWRTFERAHDAVERFQDVLGGLVDLIDDDMLFDKYGNLTTFGLAQIGNYVKQLELARNDVKNYSNDIDNLNKLYSEGWYTSEEYKEKLGELQSKLLDSASSMKDYISSIRDMYKEMDQQELDALFKIIDARNDALNAKKDYYEYDKSIRDKSKDIESLNAQIAALEDVDTAEARSKSAQLKEQLSDAKEELNDTKQEHLFDISQDALSKLKETLQDESDDRWNYLGSNLEAIAQILTDANALTSENAAAIENTLNGLLGFYDVNSNSTGIYNAGINSSQFKGLTQYLAEASQYSKPTTAGIKQPRLISSIGSGIDIQQNYDSLIHIDGSADAATVEDLKNISKKILEDSYNYTAKRINEDYVRTGGRRTV